ncbi:MAG: flagellar protein FliT [Butyrivibrio sp.]|uniref:flagellar protein FliT n=1 Tax=Butyrivibrio sp. TaxID=28121 RepID=UPI0025FA0F3B|nr:flagellar protein FliT [Butyrivibrio sp.]MCR5771933.1 flagellar protein FliT [Butyrivibrio sp.]
MTETYLDMMEDSLRMKLKVMQEIEVQNGLQKEALERSEGPDEEAFDKAVHEKGDLIDKLTELNDGFAGLYDKVKIELDGNKYKYREQIQRMQNLIRDITDLSNTLEVQETRNKDLADNYFSKTRKDMKQGKQSAAAAFSYHVTMNKSANIQPHFIDNHG